MNFLMPAFCLSGSETGKGSNINASWRWQPKKASHLTLEFYSCVFICQQGFEWNFNFLILVSNSLLLQN